MSALDEPPDINTCHKVATFDIAVDDLPAASMVSAFALLWGMKSKCLVCAGRYPWAQLRTIVRLVCVELEEDGVNNS